MGINLEALGVEPEPRPKEDLAARLARELTAGRSREDLLRLAGMFVRNQAQAESVGGEAEQPEGMPQTPDELHSHIISRYGVQIAREAVCHDHDTPFDYVCAGFFETYPNVFGIGPRGGGKCLAEGTPIYDPTTATDRPIEGVQEGGLVGSLDADGNVVSSEVAKAFFSGEKECYEVTTASGRRVVGSVDHPLLTADGWTRIEDLEVGGTVAVPARLPSHDLKHVPKEDVDLLAILLAEGNYTQSSIVSFVSYDDEIVAIAKRAAEVFGGRLNSRPSGTYGLVGQGRGYRNPIRRYLLDKYACGYAKATEKQIPAEIMAAPQRSVSRFLSIFWMCDGWIGHRSPEITLASEKMVRQIQRLLLRLGIQSRVYKTSSSYGSSESFPCWRLVVYAKFVGDFARQIVLWGDKRAKLDEIVAKKRNGNVGRPNIPEWLPAMLAAPLASMSKADRGERSRAIAADLGWATNKHAKGMQALTVGGVGTVQIRRLRAMCDRTPGVDKRRLVHLLSEDLWWDAVVSIEPVGVKRTYDLTVPSTGCFVAGDVIVHNSYDQALLHDLNSHWKPGCESATFGAVEEQAKRVYAAFKTFLDRDEVVGEPKISETLYKPVGDMNYGSKVEVLGGTVAAVNGPHPQKAHSDEVEIMRADTWKESRNLASAKTTPDGRHIKAQNYGTSTMKWKGGRVWQILESFKRAKEKAIERYGADADKELIDDLITKTTTFYVLVWCIFEVAEQVPTCRAVPENEHLPEWEPGMNRAECKCDCHEIVNGTLEALDENDEPLPRTLESECQGRFYRSRGHRTRAEVIQLFLQNDVRTWRAQQLCRETETEGLYLPNFSRQRHGLARFPLDHANGPIYTGTDWGFTDEAAVIWIQYLERPVEALRYDGKMIVVPRGARVAISERTIAQKTATELAQEAILREIKLANVLSAPRISVRKRWADLQGAGDRRDWAKKGLKTARYSTRNFDEHVKEWRGLVDANRFFVVIDEDRFTGMGCPALADQMEGWREEDGKESRELPQHVVSAARYCIYGMHDIYQDSGAQSPEQAEAFKFSTSSASAPTAKPYRESTDDQTARMETAGWRSSF